MEKRGVLGGQSQLGPTPEMGWLSVSVGNTDAACGSQKNIKNILRTGKHGHSEMLKNSV